MVDSVNVGGQPNPDSAAKQAEHDAAMAAKAESGVSSLSSVNKQTGENIHLSSQSAPRESDDKPKRPDDIPEKFWDAEKGEVNVAALLKAQQDAEAALRKAQQEKQKGGQQDSEAAAEPQERQESAIEHANKEFAERGELSDETYEALEKSGLPRDVVDSYIAGQKAIVAQLQNAAYSVFEGGQTDYQKAVEWAANNLTEEEIAALDVQLTSTNPAIVAQGAKALAARYKAEADIEPARHIAGDASSSNTGSYFKSSYEMTKAMADPRYAKDEAYRREVQQKIDRAVKAGVNLFG